MTVAFMQYVKVIIWRHKIWKRHIRHASVI